MFGQTFREGCLLCLIADKGAIREHAAHITVNVPTSADEVTRCS